MPWKRFKSRKNATTSHAGLCIICSRLRRSISSPQTIRGWISQPKMGIYERIRAGMSTETWPCKQPVYLFLCSCALGSKPWKWPWKFPVWWKYRTVFPRTLTSSKIFSQLGSFQVLRLPSSPQQNSRIRKMRGRLNWREKLYSQIRKPSSTWS